MALSTRLILTQGVLYAIAGTVAYAPTILFVDDWFMGKKGHSSEVFHLGIPQTGKRIESLGYFLATI